MNAKRRNDKVVELFCECMDTLRKKGADYSGDTDCLKNFRRFGSHGILIRMNDKLERLITLDGPCHTAKVTESIKDTVLDLINYAALYLVVKDDESNAGSTGPAPERDYGPTAAKMQANASKGEAHGCYEPVGKAAF